MGKKSYMAMGVIAGLLSCSHSTWAQETNAKTEEETVIRKSEKVITPVSMDVKGEVVQDVLGILFEQRVGASVIFDNSVPEKEITLNFKNMPWDKAFVSILTVAGLEAVETSSNVFLIKQKRGIVTDVEDLTVELYMDKDIDQISGSVLKNMLKGQIPSEQPLNTGEMRDVLRTSDKVFIKSLEVKNQPAVDVIKALVKVAKLNFSFSDELVSAPAPVVAEGTNAAPAPVRKQRRISMSLKNMELEKVLSMVAKKAGYTCIKKDGLWEVSPMKASALQPLVVDYFEVRFLAVDDDLIELLTSLLSGKKGAKRGAIRPGKNKYIVVKATETDIEAVRRTLEIMDRPTPQVMIEARFFELKDGSGDYLGLDWQGIRGKTVRVQTDGLGQYIGDATGATLLHGKGVNLVGSGLLKGIGKTAIVNSSEFQATLGMLNENSNAKNLSNPKIVVASGEQATIHIGEKYPILKTTVSGQNSDKSTELDKAFGSEENSGVDLIGGSKKNKGTRISFSNTPGYLDLGTMLTVAPSVKTAEEVYIKVVPNLTTSDKEVTSGGNTYPITFSTVVQTEFTLKSGQTIAIGGLVKQSESKVERAVPLLGSIPLLGRLFKYDEDKSSSTETIIFLTVKIMSAKDLKTTSGIPASSKLSQPIIDEVRKADSQGAEYIDVVPKAEAPKKEKVPEVDLDKQLKDIQNVEYGYQKEIDHAMAELRAQKAAQK